MVEISISYVFSFSKNSELSLQSQNSVSELSLRPLFFLPLACELVSSCCVAFNSVYEYEASCFMFHCLGQILTSSWNINSFSSVKLITLSSEWFFPSHLLFLIFLFYFIVSLYFPWRQNPHQIHLYVPCLLHILQVLSKCLSKWIFPLYQEAW